MFYASYFTYDGVFSGEFGLQIADFEKGNPIYTDVFSPSLNTVKPPRVPRFFHGGINYDSPPQMEVTFLSETVMDDVARRKALSWLVGRNEYKILKIHQSDLEDYHYRCIFTNVSIVYINGYCHGFKALINFDSSYQYGSPVVYEATGTGNLVEITFTNKSDTPDEYVYPIVEFTPKGDISSAQGVKVRILNTTDSSSRYFEFFDRTGNSVPINKKITVDNELQLITIAGTEKVLQNFNRNWLRLKQGDNNLRIYVNGNIKITCPTYVKIGF